MEKDSYRTIIRMILLTQWDPIGISDIPEAQDEYHAYAETLCGMLANGGASVDRIAHTLNEIATKHMGLSYAGLDERCRTTARAIMAVSSDL